MDELEQGLGEGIVSVLRWRTSEVDFGGKRIAMSRDLKIR